MGNHGSGTIGTAGPWEWLHHPHGHVGDEQTFLMGPVSLRMLNELISICSHPSWMRGAWVVGTTSTHECKNGNAHELGSWGQTQR